MAMPLLVAVGAIMKTRLYSTRMYTDTFPPSEERLQPLVLRGIHNPLRPEPQHHLLPSDRPMPARQQKATVDGSWVGLVRT